MAQPPPLPVNHAGEGWKKDKISRIILVDYGSDGYGVGMVEMSGMPGILSAYADLEKEGWTHSYTQLELDVLDLKKVKGIT